MNNYRSIPLLCLIVFSTLLAVPSLIPHLSADAEVITLYVSPEGNDAWSGERPSINADGSDGPVKTAQMALQRIRKLRSHPQKAVVPARIVFSKGIHTLDRPIILGPNDSYLTLEGDPSGESIISGGCRITGWAKREDPFWEAPLKWVKQDAWDFRQFYVNGAKRNRARLPGKGFFEHESRFSSQWINSRSQFEPPPNPDDKTRMVYKAGQLGPEISLKNAEFIIHHSWDASWSKAISHDPLARSLRLDPPCINPPGAFGIMLYAVENIKEGMREGCWYLDREQGKVVYWPLPGENPNESIIEAPALQTLIRIEGAPDQLVRDITIRDLHLDLTNVKLTRSGWGADQYEGALSGKWVSNCRFKGLNVSRSGGQGIKVVFADHLIIEDSEIHHTGANGIVLSRGQENTIINNRIHHIGLFDPGGIGINANRLQRTRIAHNEVSATSYCGIALGNATSERTPAENILEYNRVWDVMNGLDDGGCIYLYGKERFTVVRGNVLSESHGRSGVAAGLYLDMEVENVRCEENLVLDVNKWVLLVHMTKGSIIRNNLFVCNPGGTISFSLSSDCLFERNIVYAPNSAITFVNSGGARFRHNLYFSGIDAIKNPPEGEEGALIAEPQFNDPANHDFRLMATSPAYKLGFRPTDFSKAGRYDFPASNRQKN